MSPFFPTSVAAPRLLMLARRSSLLMAMGLPPAANNITTLSPLLVSLLQLRLWDPLPLTARAFYCFGGDLDKHLTALVLYYSSFESGPTDGLMGLAFPALSAFPATPFFNTLMSQGSVDAGVFGFYLASNGSELFLGGTDTSLYTGDIDWNPVTQEVSLSTCTLHSSRPQLIRIHFLLS